MKKKWIRCLAALTLDVMLEQTARAVLEAQQDGNM